MIALWIILGLLVCFVGVLAVRALRFTPKAASLPQASPVIVDEEGAIRRFQAMIQKKTVSYVDRSKMDQKEFAAFRELLPTLYPKVHAACQREIIGSGGMLYTWKGKSSAAPSVLMAHYDVVPVKEEDWKEPPFSAALKDGEIWGRGTLDTKCTLHGVLEAAEGLLAEGFQPENDLYFAFGGDEEIMGEDAPAMVRELEGRGVKPAFVLDEGGAIVEGVFPGVKQSAALIGIAEKGTVSMEVTATGKGGHASTPPVRQSLTVLARAILRMQKPMPFTLTKPAMELFDAMGRYSGFAFRLIFANLWCFAPLLDVICKKSGGELNALVRTTCAFTMARGAEAFNVLPREATAGVNLRLIPGDTMEQAKRRLEKAVGDPGVTFTIRQGQNPSAISKTYDGAWERLVTAIRQTYPQALVAPYLMVAATDSRHYCRISDNVYRFGGMPLSKEQRGLIHNADERIPVALLGDYIAFFTRLIRLS